MTHKAGLVSEDANSGAGSVMRPSRAVWAAGLLLILLLGIVLRVLPLGREALDGDELFSLRVAVLPLHDSMEAIRTDLVHPPLYYMVLRTGVHTWGASPTGVRFLSFIFGIAAILLVAFIGDRLPAARYTGLLAAALVAVNADQIFYSDEGRSYAFYVVLVLLLIAWAMSVARTVTPSLGKWIAGFLLMIVLVYTHYIGAIYIFSVVLALLICTLPRRTKMVALALAVVTAILFVPWLMNIANVYRSKHGVGANLNWEGHPGLHDLNAIWAGAVGLVQFRGATSLILLLVIALSLVALNVGSKQRSFRESPGVLVLAFASFLPPVLVFVLSVRPVNLPLFGLRQLLPSMAALALLVSCGMEKLALRTRRYGAVFAMGSVVLLLIALVPTYQSVAHRPSRYPYDRIAEAVRSRADQQAETYTTWFYGIGEPVNYYCHAICVQSLPSDDSSLQQKLVLLYRPAASSEVQRYQELLKLGYVPQATRYYTNGQQSPWGASMVYLVRTGETPPEKSSAISPPRLKAVGQ